MTTSIALPQPQVSRFTSINVSNKLALSVLFFALAIAFMSAAFAGADATAVDDLWATLSGWASGAPGKIIALLSFLSAVWFGIVKPNYTNAIGSLVFCLLMANATEIIENFLTMSV